MSCAMLSRTYLQYYIDARLNDRLLFYSRRGHTRHASISLIHGVKRRDAPDILCFVSFWIFRLFCFFVVLGIARPAMVREGEAVREMCER